MNSCRNSNLELGYLKQKRKRERERKSQKKKKFPNISYQIECF